MAVYAVKKGFAIIDVDRDVVNFFSPETIEYKFKKVTPPLGDKCEERADEFIKTEENEWGNKYFKEYGYVVFEDSTPILVAPTEEDANAYIAKMKRPNLAEEEIKAIARRKRKENDRYWQKKRIENIRIYGCENPTRDQIALHEMAREMRIQREIDVCFYGDTNPSRAKAYQSLNQLQKELAEEEKWLRANPKNPIWQENVERKREAVAKQQRVCDKCGKNDTVIREIKKAVNEYKNEEKYLTENSLLDFALELCNSLERFQKIFNNGGAKVISTHFVSQSGPFDWGRDKESVKLIVCEDDDDNYTDIYEIAYTGQCRKLSEEESAIIRNKKRMSAEAAINREEQTMNAPSEKGHTWLDRNGHLIGWAIFAVFLIWIIGGTISHMP